MYAAHASGVLFNDQITGIKKRTGEILETRLRGRTSQACSRPCRFGMCNSVGISSNTVGDFLPTVPFQPIEMAAEYLGLADWRNGLNWQVALKRSSLITPPGGHLRPACSPNKRRGQVVIFRFLSCARKCTAERLISM